jgi:hypothetical protein
VDLPLNLGSHLPRLSVGLALGLDWGYRYVEACLIDPVGQPPQTHPRGGPICRGLSETDSPSAALVRAGISTAAPGSVRCAPGEKHSRHKRV